MPLLTIADRLTKFSGEDYMILQRCERPFRARFAWVGSFVLLIFIGCFLSCTYAIYSLFERNWLLSIPIGLFFGWMVVNIYLLLLYTLTPSNLITGAKEEKMGVLSFTLRILFIMLLAVILAKPISVWFFDGYLQKDVTQYKKELLSKHLVQADSLIIEQEKSLVTRYTQDIGFVINNQLSSNADLANAVLLKVGRDSLYLKQLNLIQQKVNQLAKQPRKNRAALMSLKEDQYITTQAVYEDDVRFLTELNRENLSIPPTLKIDSLNHELAKGVIALIEKKRYSQESLAALLDRTSFFIYKTKVVSGNYLLSWLIDFGVILVFFLPVLWKHKERKLLRYYAIRSRIEKQIVIDEYETFKHQYALTMKRVTGKDIEFYEPFADPPFNTIRKKDAKELKPQEDFLNKVYGVG